jgi:hypothetical protein
VAALLLLALFTLVYALTQVEPGRVAVKAPLAPFVNDSRA